MDHIIEQTGLQSEVIYGLKGALKKQGLLEEPEAEEEEEEAEEGEETEEEEESEVVTPPEVETIEEARIFIRERLDMVYGVGKALNVVMRALYDDPSSLRDPTLLHAFIKSLAPKANDQQLSVMVIKPLYAQLPTLPMSVSQYLSSMQPPPQPPFYWGTPTGWQPYRHLYPTRPGSSPYGYPADPYGNQGYPGYPYPQPPAYPNPQAWYEAQPRKSSKRYKVVVDGQEIETDESGFRAWKEYLDGRERARRKAEQREEEHELMKRKLEEEIKEAAGSKAEDKVSVKIGDEIMEVPASIAPLYLKGEDEEVRNLRKRLDDEREGRHRAEMQRLEEKIDNRPTLNDQIEYVRSMAPYFGFNQGGRTTLDVVDSLRGDLQSTAQALLNKLPAPGGEGFQPEVRRTPQERRDMAGRIKMGLEKTEGIMEAENELIKATSRVRT